MMALQISLLCRRYGFPQERAAMLARLIWGNGDE